MTKTLTDLSAILDQVAHTSALRNTVTMRQSEALHRCSGHLQLAIDSLAEFLNLRESEAKENVQKELEQATWGA